MRLLRALIPRQVSFSPSGAGDLSRNEEGEMEKTGASPLRAVRIFSTGSDEFIAGAGLSKRVFPAARGLGATIFLIAAFSLDSPAQANPKVRYSVAEKACSPEEAWKLSDKVPKMLAKQLERPPTTREEALKSYLVAYRLKELEKSPENKFFSYYVMARALFQINLPHLAYVGFQNLVTAQGNKDTDGIKISALECINRIQSRHPTFTMEPATMDGLRGVNFNALSSAQREIVVASAISYIWKHSKSEAYPNNVNLLGLVKTHAKGTVFESYASAVWSAQRQAYGDVVKYATEALASPTLSRLTEEDRDVLQILLARAYFNTGNMEKSIAELKKVRRESSYFTSTFTDIAWAYLNQGKYQETVSTSYNLMVGPLSKGFSSDAPVIAAIAYFETCNYPQALQTMRFFKKNYLPSYRWLYKWRAADLAGKKKNLYQLALSLLKDPDAKPADPKEAVPKRVFSEWLSSKALSTYQQEINLLLDEKTALDEFSVTLKKWVTVIKDGRKQAFANLLARVNGFSEQIPAMKNSLIQKIESDLVHRSSDLLEQVSESTENGQLVEVEILNAAGEDIIRKNLMANSKKSDQEPKIERQSSDGPSLDWGRYPASSEENQEVWEDEYGFLKSEVKDLCKKR